MTKSNLTKKTIVHALKELMKKKPVQKISIRELTEKANINRQTFYYHFDDIYDCIQWMYQEEAAAALKRKTDEKKWQEGLLELFKYIDNNKEVAMCVINSVGRKSLREFLFDDINKVCLSFISAFTKSTDSESIVDNNKDYIDFLMKYYTMSIMSIMESYLLGELHQKPEEIIALIDTTIKDHIAGACARLKIRPARID